MGDRLPTRERRRPVRLQDGAATALAPQRRTAKRARLTLQEFESGSDDEGAATGLVELRQQAGCEPEPASQDAGTAQAAPAPAPATAAVAAAAAGVTTRTQQDMTIPWRLQGSMH